jgi:hypothetical protein
MLAYFMNNPKQRLEVTHMSEQDFVEAVATNPQYWSATVPPGVPGFYGLLRSGPYRTMISNGVDPETAAELCTLAAPWDPALAAMG